LHYRQLERFIVSRHEKHPKGWNSVQLLGGSSEQWSNFCPGLAIVSSLHETQYTRLFRS